MLVSVVGFGLAMLSTQPEQQLRRRVENEIEAGQYVAALGLLSSHPRGDFPPHWDPPPRTFSPFHFRSPGHVLGMCELFDCTTPAWVHEAYLEKLKMMMQLGGGRTEDERSRLVRLLHRLPEAPELLDALREENSHRYEELVEQLRLTETEQDVSKR